MRKLYFNPDCLQVHDLFQILHQTRNDFQDQLFGLSVSCQSFHFFLLKTDHFVYLKLYSTSSFSFILLFFEICLLLSLIICLFTHLYLQEYFKNYFN